MPENQPDIHFKALWDNHPTLTGDDDPCSINGHPQFSNQCAIRMGVSLTRCGVDTSRLSGVRHCWFPDHQGKGHALSAEELAQGLKMSPLRGVNPCEIIDPETFKKQLMGRTGIVFFKDYWQRSSNGVRESFRNRSGDHIDLWNGSRLSDWTTWFRIQMGLSVNGYWSDFKQSKAIWFWGVS